MSGSSEYLRAADIAQLTGMHIRTIRRWIAARVVPSAKLGGARLVARADLDRLLGAPPEPINDDDSEEEYDGDSGQ